MQTRKSRKMAGRKMEIKPRRSPFFCPPFFCWLTLCLCIFAAGLLALSFAKPAAAEGSGERGAADDAAAFKSQTLQTVYPLPPHLEGTSSRPLPAHIYVQPKARITVSIEMSNNGTSDWLQTNPGSCLLMPRPDDRAWGGGKGLGSNVFPGESHVFNFGASAPETERTGGHTFQWQMRRSPFSDGAPAVLFGELTQPVRIHVDGTRPVGTASFPSSIPTDQPFTITGTSADNEGQDNSGVYNVRISIDGREGNANPLNGSWSNWSYEAAGLLAGDHTAIIVITDRAGNITTTGHFSFTNDAPPRALSFKAPATGALSSNTNPCLLATGESQCATTIRWRSNGASTAQLWMSQDGGSLQFLACGASGERGVGEMQTGHVYRFFLYPAQSCEPARIEGSELATMAVTAAQASVGLNKPDLFSQYRGSQVSQAMARKAVNDAKNIGVSYLRFQEIADINAWRNNPAGYWAPHDQMMNDLAANGLRALPVFLWNANQFQGATGENATQLIANPQSNSYQLLTRYITDFINRYKNHQALYFYELTNRTNREADAQRGAGGNYSTDQHIAFINRLAAYVRGLDPTRLISSGFALPNAWAERVRAQPQYSLSGGDFNPDTVAEFQKNLAEIHQAVDIVSVHFNNQERDFFDAGQRRANERFGLSGRANAELLTLIKQTTDAMGKQLFIGAFEDRTPYLNQDPTGPFTQNVLDKIVQLKIAYSAVWSWEYYETNPFTTYNNQNTFSNLEPGYTDLLIARIKQANLNLGNPLPAQQSPDTTAPQIVLTEPTENRTIAANQLVHAVASDNNGAVTKVEFLVNDVLKATVTRPPYQFRLDTAAMSAGRYRIVAKAYDAAGNSSQQLASINHPGGFAAVASVSAASYSEAAVAREAIVAAFGSNLATATAAANATPLPTTLAGTRVVVRDSEGAEREAPLFFVSPAQINYQIPLEAAVGEGVVTITNADGKIVTGAIEIAAIAPGLFTADSSGRGIAAATALRVRADGSQQFEPVAQFDALQGRIAAVPIDLGEVGDQVFLLLFGAGLRHRSMMEAVSVTIGGVEAPVTYAGAQGGFVGLDQVNVRVPRELAGRGEVDVVMIVDGRAANVAQVRIK
jgi:uncharacterized protein (TIGR03437 family)